MVTTFNFQKVVRLACLLTVSAHAAEPVIPPEDGMETVAFRPGEKLRITKKQNSQAVGKWVKIEEMSFSDAYRIDITDAPKAPKNIQLLVPVKKEIKKGDAVLFTFWLSRPKSGGIPGPAAAYLQGSAKQARYEYIFSGYRQWQQHARAFKAPADYKAGTGNICIHLGASGPRIDIADLRVINYGTEVDVETLPETAITYEGREADAPWRKDALARIEKHRKGDMIVEVVGADGKPLKNAEVSVQMQRHAFEFGNAVNSMMLGGKEEDFPYTKKRSGEAYSATWKDAQQYRKIVKDYFSCVTFESELRPHLWKRQMSGHPKWKKDYRILTKQTVPWLQSNNIGVRGHYISWGAIDFTDLEKPFVGNPEGHRKWLWAHMADILPKTNGFVTEWDTLNHIVAWGKHTYEKEYGGLDIYVDVMKEARRLAPQAKHAVNEGKVLPNGYKREPYKRMIRYLVKHGQAPDRVGFMAHFGLTSLTPPEELLEVYDDFSEIVPHLQLSELDVEAGDDEQLQSDYYRDVMIASFSHPSFEAIIQWGFWENMHWKPAAALWRADWSLKPAGQVFVDLVKKHWWTDAKTQTSEDGSCKIRGFLGDYTVSVNHEGKTVTAKAVLERKGTRVRIQLK